MIDRIAKRSQIVWRRRKKKYEYEYKYGYEYKKNMNDEAFHTAHNEDILTMKNNMKVLYTVLFQKGQICTNWIRVDLIRIDRIRVDLIRIDADLILISKIDNLFFRLSWAV